MGVIVPGGMCLKAEKGSGSKIGEEDDNSEVLLVRYYYLV